MADIFISGAALGAKLFIATFVFSLIYSTATKIMSSSEYGRDDADPPKERSNLSVKTDHKTGVQYLVTWSGNITPRIDAQGNIITIEAAE